MTAFGEMPPWEVGSSMVGDGFHVYPKAGLGMMGNWAMNPYHRRGVANVVTQVYRYLLTGIALRREYPKNERQLRKALAECHVFCDLENEATRRAKEIYARVQHPR